MNIINKYKLVAMISTCVLTLTCKLPAQVLSFDPGLPNTTVAQELSSQDATIKAEAALPALDAYAGTYVGGVVYYNIDNGVGDWEIVFRKNGTIGLSANYQNKYPTANVSGTFHRDGTFQYTNRQTDGLTFVTTGKINLTLEKLSARFTSSSAGTGTIVCHKLVAK